MYSTKTMLVVAAFTLLAATLAENVKKDNDGDNEIEGNATEGRKAGRRHSSGGRGRRMLSIYERGEQSSNSVCMNAGFEKIIEELNAFRSSFNVVIENTNRIEILRKFIEVYTRGGNGGSSLGAEIQKYIESIRELVEYQLGRTNERLAIIETKVISPSTACCTADVQCCSSGTLETSSLEAKINSLAEKVDFLISQQGTGGSNADIQSILQLVTQIHSFVTTGSQNTCSDPRMSEIEIILREMRNSHVWITEEIRTIRSEIQTVVRKVSSGSSSGMSKKLDIIIKTFKLLKTGGPSWPSFDGVMEGGLTLGGRESGKSSLSQGDKDGSFSDNSGGVNTQVKTSTMTQNGLNFGQSDSGQSSLSKLSQYGSFSDGGGGENTQVKTSTMAKDGLNFGLSDSGQSSLSKLSQYGSFSDGSGGVNTQVKTSKMTNNGWNFGLSDLGQSSLSQLGKYKSFSASRDGRTTHAKTSTKMNNQKPQQSSLSSSKEQANLDQQSNDSSSENLSA